MALGQDADAASSGESHQGAALEHLPKPDTRSAAYVTFDQHGMRPMRYDDLHRRADTWPTTAATPDGIAALLRTARKTFALGIYHYELFVVASTWSLMAVEAALRVHYDVTDKIKLFQLIDRAGHDGIFNEVWVERLHAGRQLRNDLVHARTSMAFTPAMATTFLSTSHDAVAILYAH